MNNISYEFTILILILVDWMLTNGQPTATFKPCVVTVNVRWLFLTVPWVGLQFVIVVFPDHAHFFKSIHLGYPFVY